MVLLYTLNENFKATTQGLNPAIVWTIKLVLLAIAIAVVLLFGNVIFNGAPKTIGY